MAIPPTTARPTYSRRPVPKQYDAGWLGIELGNLQRAFVPVQSRMVTASGPVRATDCVLYVDATAGDITLTLPNPNQVQDLVVTIKKVDATSHPVTIQGTVDATPNPTLTTPYQGIIIGSNGLVYYQLGTL